MVKVYLLLWGHECCFDGDNYVGIYTNVDDLKVSYDNMIMEGSEEISLRPQIRVFEEVNSKKQRYWSVDGETKINKFFKELLIG